MAIDHFKTVRPQISLASLAPFLLIAFGLAWGIFALFILIPEPITALFGPITGRHPLFLLAVYSPAIAAFILVTYHHGLGGLRRYLSRLFLWRCAPAWYGFLLLGIPLIFMGGTLLKGNLLVNSLPFGDLPLETYPLIVALAYTAITGPIEEFGWRGFALPLLQRRFSPLWSGLILGLIWGLWHLPAFLLSGTPQSGWSFTPFLLGSIALSLLITPLFNASRGSILLPMLFHFQTNNPLWPNAQPYDIALFIAAALLTLWLNRKTMLNSKRAVTEIVPQPKY